MNTPFIIGLVALGIGVAVLLIGGSLTARGIYRDSRWVRTQGVIVGFNSDGAEIPTTFAILTYRDAAGQEHKSETKCPDSVTYPALGSPVTVRYDPRNPARVEFERGQYWWTEWIFFVGLFGFGLSLVGILMIALTGRQRDAVTNVPPAGDGESSAGSDTFFGTKGGDEREVAGVKVCWCPPGKFIMGSPPDEPERRPDEAQVEVTLTRGFWMGKYVVTQGQWKRVVGKLPGELTAELGEGDDLPVGNVNYAEAEMFCLKLTELGRQTSDLPAGWEFRLPTEAQWEYACRAGTTTATAFGDKLSSKQANFQGRSYNGAEKGPSLNRAATVGSYPANAWGLHDMHGNICEWCRDWYHQKLPGGSDPDLSSIKGRPNRDGTYSRVRRNGAWCDDGWPCRSASRLRFEPERRYDHIGFRVALVRP